MNHTSVIWIYGLSAVAIILSLFGVVQFLFIDWLLSMLCENTKTYKGFCKLKKWAYALFFINTVAAFVTMIALLTYTKIGKL